MKWFGLLATALLVTSASTADPAAAQRKKKNNYPAQEELAAQMNRERATAIAARDKKIADAHAAGKVILLTRTMNLDRIYSSAEINENFSTRILYNANYSSRTKWVKRGDASAYVAIGNSARKSEPGDPLTNFANKNSLDEMYQIYIVEPGDYDLVGHSNFLRMTSTPAVHWATAGQSVAPGLGKVSMKETQFEEFWHETQWENAQFQTRVITDQYCSAIYIYSGGCASWGSSKREVTDLSKAAGYYSSVVAKMMPAVTAHFELNRPFASFNAAPGDVIVVDGMFADYPNAEFGTNDCLRISTDAVDCSLSSYSLIQLPASVAGMNQALTSIAHDYPNLAMIARSAKAVPIKISGTQGGTPSRWGPRYVMTNGTQAAQ